MSRKEPWYDNENPSSVARSAAWRVGVGLLVLMAVVALIGGITFGIHILTAAPKGKAEAYRQKGMRPVRRSSTSSSSSPW